MKDWVIDGSNYKARIELKNGQVQLSNGLVSRTIEMKSSATVSYQNINKGIEYITKAACDVRFTCDEAVCQLDEGFAFVGATLVAPVKMVDFFPNESMSERRSYPPAGNAVELEYIHQPLQLRVRVHYEIYDAIPTIMKQVFIENLDKKTRVIANIQSDIMIICDHRNTLFIDSNFNAATDFSGLDINAYAALYARFVYEQLEVAPKYAMNVKVLPGATVASIIAFESAFSADYYEQRLIEVKMIYRHIAPWTLDTALFFHLISNSSTAIRKAVDQCAEIGLEMVIQSFGSGVRMESDSRRYLKRIKIAYDYGHSKGIRMGAYTLAYVKNYLPVRGAEAINHDGSHICRCLATDWAKKYTQTILRFLDATGADAIEIDGPYGMQLCAGGKTHLHENFTDSQYHQWKLSVDEWYKEIRKRNVYINAPDWHFLNGTNRSGVGYEEIAFSEKRAEQLVTSRIYYYKGTFSKSPSMGWGFLPLNVYHGGGKDAKFGPTDVNQFEFDWAMAQIVASGVWPTLRGKKVYDSRKGKEILSKWVGVFKKYRQVLNGITVHFMPPVIDKNNPTKTVCVDAIMNALPYGDTRAFVMFFNQTDNQVTQAVHVPVYYTGLTELQSPPPPFEQTKSCDVEYPVYGEEVSPLVILAREGKSRTYITDKKFEDKPIPKAATPVQTEKQITVVNEKGEEKKYWIDSNGNITIDLHLKPMSYCYYTMKQAD